MPSRLVIRRCRPDEEPLMSEIVCDAASAYRGVIPADRYHEPYMPLAELQGEIAAGVEFWGAEVGGTLTGIMGIQDVDTKAEDDIPGVPSSGGESLGHVTLIRHAYVRTAQRGQGLGGLLLLHLLSQVDLPVLIGTWAAAEWAVRFYEKHGFTLTSHAEKETLLRRYWSVPARQVETSVVLADAKAMRLLRSAEAGRPA
jgi:GNAT superfamily N-acetyltransferase